jgi:tRNA threonylcarbamoyladenosine biosynthesis protein TsaB
MIDARRMEVYCQIVSATMNIIQPTQAKVVNESSFTDLLQDHVIVFFGNGAGKCQEVIQHDNARFITDVFPSAVPLGELARIKFNAEDFVDVAYFEPAYLKEFQAIKPRKLVK